MKGVLGWLSVAAGAVLVLLVLALFNPMGSLPWAVGRDGFVTRSFPDAPYPYSFEKPASWSDSPRGSNRGHLGVMLIGPLMASGRFYTTIIIEVSPTTATHAARPYPGIVRPYQSVEDLEARHFYFGKRTGVESTTTVVAGRTARDSTYSFVSVARSGPGEEAANSVNCRGRSVYFEDRGFYYVFKYAADAIEYERYGGIFERVLSSFRFLD